LWKSAVKFAKKEKYIGLRHQIHKKWRNKQQIIEKNLLDGS